MLLAPPPPFFVAPGITGSSSSVGRPLQPTLDFARRLATLGRRMWIRYVLVPGLTDRPGDISRLADFIATLGPAAEKVEVLPFHQLGAPKWHALDLTYHLADTKVPTEAAIASARGIFAERGLVVT